MILRCCAWVLSAIGTASNAVTSSLLASFAFRLSSFSSSFFSLSAAWRRYFTVRASTVSAAVSASNGAEERPRGSHVTDRGCHLGEWRVE